MTLFVDTSALIKRYLLEVGSDLVLQVMDRDLAWCMSTLVIAEARRVICRADASAAVSEARDQALRSEMQRFTMIAVDGPVIARATEISCRYGTRTLDSIHLAAADQLPAPITFLTFDVRQAEAARGLGFNLEGIDVSPG